MRSLLQLIGLGTLLFIGTCCYLAFKGTEGNAPSSARDARVARAAEVARKKQIEKKYAAAAQSPIEPGALIAYYSENEVAGDANLKGRLVAIKGKVSTIGKDILGTPYISFEGPSNTFRSVQCMFEKSDEPQLARLSRGTELVVVGECGGMMGNILIGSIPFLVEIPNGA